MRFTPYEMKILLEVYVGAPITACKTAPVYEPTMMSLVEREYVKPCEDEYAPTDKLNVLMHYVLSAPDPVWAIPA